MGFKVITDNALLAEAAVFYADELKIRRGKVQIGYSACKEPQEGWCAFDGKRGITIGLDREADNVLSVLAHEMVHAQQFLYGRLRDLEDDMVLFDGDVYMDAETASEAYYELPWEKEAFKRQDELAQKFYLKKALDMAYQLGHSEARH